MPGVFKKIRYSEGLLRTGNERPVLGKERERVEIFVACELFSVAHTGGKILPGNNRWDRSLAPWRRPVRHQLLDNIVNRFALLSECPLILVFRLCKEAADEPVV